MSEPWLVDDFYSLAKTNTSSSGNSNSNSNSNGTRNILHAISQPPIYLSTALSELIPHPLGAKIEAIERGTAISPNYMVPVGIAAWASRKMKTPSFAAMSMTTANCNASSSSGSGPMSTHSTPLPQILEGDYSTVYNKNGRIGIYTREERQSIITRFQDKRRNRVWKKKIRYHCRKNLADRRVRIKVTRVFSLILPCICQVLHFFSFSKSIFIVVPTLNFCIQGRFVRAVDGSSPLGESSDTRDTDIDTDKNLTGVGYREADYKEPEMDGVTSSEEGEINQPMDVSEVETSPSDTGGFFTSEGSAEDLRLAAALVADFSNHTDSSSSSDGSIRNFSRHKQQLGSQRAGEGQGSAADGMKAFWGVIHESSSSSSLNIASAMVSLSYDPASKDGITVQENGGRAIRHKAEENTEESENEDKIENDEAVDLWSENDNVEGLSDMDSQTKKRFRRYTIAY